MKTFIRNINIEMKKCFTFHIFCACLLQFWNMFVFQIVMMWEQIVEF